MESAQIILRGREMRWLRRIISLMSSPPKDTGIDLMDLEAGNKEMTRRVEQLQATIDSDEGWFLCLTRRPDVCDDKEGGQKFG